MNSPLLNTLGNSLLVTAILCSATSSTALSQENNPTGEVASQTETLTPQQRLEQLSDIEKRNLAERKKRFDRLPPHEKDRLRALQEQLEQHPENQRLKELMLAYTEWLNSLSAKQITTLQETPMKERIALIRKLKEEQEEQRFKQLVDLKLSSEDIEALVKFMGDFAMKHKEEILAKIPSDWSRRFKSLDESRQRKFLMMGLMERDGKLRVDFSAQDITSLRGKLSSQEASKAIAAARTPGKQAQLIRGWLRAAAMSRGRISVSPEEIKRFYLNDLRPEHRDFLEKLSGEELQNKLRQYYFEYRYRRNNGRRPRGRDDGRPGNGGSREGGRREDGDGRRPPGRPDGPPRGGPPRGGPPHEGPPHEGPPRDGPPRPERDRPPHEGPPEDRRQDDAPQSDASREEDPPRGRPVITGDGPGRRLDERRRAFRSREEQRQD